MADTPTSPCMVAHHEAEKNRFYYVNYGAILFNKIALSENVQMGISTDNLGMGLSAILKGVYQVRAIGSGTTPPPSVFTHTVPASMTIGQSYQISFSGVTSTQGPVTYTISTPVALGSMGVFSKSGNILAGENITLTWEADGGGGAHDVPVPGTYDFQVRAYTTNQTLVSVHTVSFTLVAASVAVAISEVFNSQIIPGGASPGAGNQAVTNVNLRDYGGAVHIKSMDFNYEHALFGLPLSNRANRRTCIPVASTQPSNTYLAGMLDVTSDTTWATTGGNNQLNQPASRYIATTYRDSPRFYRYWDWTGTGASGSTRVPLSWDETFDMGTDIGMILGMATQSGGNCVVWHRSMPTSRAMLNDPRGSNGFLTSSGSPNSGSQYWGDSLPTSREIFVGPQFNGTSAKYLFHIYAHDPSPDGVIFCGEFTHNNSTAGQLVVIGWKPQRLVILPVDGYAVYNDGINDFQMDKSYIYDKQLGWTGPHPLQDTAKTLQFSSEAAATVRTHSAIAIEETGFYPQDFPSGRYVFMAIRDDGTAPAAPVLSGTINHSSFFSGNASPGATGSFNLSGVTSDKGTVTYSVSEAGSSYVTFSKTTGIAANESVTWTMASNVPTGTTTLNFNLTADTSPASSNGPQTATHTMTVTGAVVAPTLSGTINHTMQSSVTGGNNYSFTISGKSASSGSVVYSISPSSGSQYVTFSKTSGISNGETIVMSVASNAPNGGNISGTISANASPVAASNPDAIGFSIGTLALVEPDPSFSGFSHTVPANTQQGQSYTVTFSGTSSSNGHQVWYSLSPQTGLSFSKLDNISPGEAVTMTVSGSASGTLGVSVYANTTKNSGSTFTQSLAYIQTAVAVPVTVDMDHIAIQFDMVSAGTGPDGQYWGATYKVNISGMNASDGRQIFFEIRNASWSKVYASATSQGSWVTFVGPTYNDADSPVIVAVDSAGTMYGTRYLSNQLNVTPWGNFAGLLPIYVVH